MKRSDVQQIIDEVTNGLDVNVIHVYTRFQVVNLQKDANGQFPAFTLSDTMLSLEFPGFPRYQWVSLDGIDLITAD